MIVASQPQTGKCDPHYRDLYITHVGNKFADSATEVSTVNWSELTDWLTTHIPCDDNVDKGFVRGFVPRRLTCIGEACTLKHAFDPEGTRRKSPHYRSDQHVTSDLSAVVLDCEAPDDDQGCKRGVPTCELHKMFDVLHSRGLTYAAYSTLTRPIDDDEHRYRLVLLPSRPIREKERPTVWAAVVWLLGGQYIDRATKDASRYYTFPHARTSDTHHWSASSEGAALDVDALLAEYRAANPEPVRKADVAIAQGKSTNVHAMIDLLPTLTDGRWSHVRRWAFEFGKWAAWAKWNEPTALASGEQLFDVSLSRCDLSARNPKSKCLDLARACIANGWRVRSTELTIAQAKIERVLRSRKLLVP